MSISWVVWVFDLNRRNNVLGFRKTLPALVKSSNFPILGRSGTHPPDPRGPNFEKIKNRQMSLNLALFCISFLQIHKIPVLHTLLDEFDPIVPQNPRAPTPWDPDNGPKISKSSYFALMGKFGLFRSAGNVFLLPNTFFLRFKSKAQTTHEMPTGLHKRPHY